MDDGLKQRLIGAFVLFALAVIFLPAFFDRESMQPVDKKTQIPAAPHLETVEIEETQRVDVDVEAKPPESMFIPEDPEQDAAVDDQNNNAAENTGMTVSTTEEPKEKSTPSVNESNENENGKGRAIAQDENGVPQGWVLQVASFKEQDRATALMKELNDEGYKAFTRTIETQKGSMTRLYVGPKLDKNQLLKEKSSIEKKFKLSTLIVKFSP